MEELKARGYDKNGKLLDRENNQVGTVRLSSMASGILDDLKGSLRFHILAPAIPAKFVDIKAEVAKALDTVIQGQNSDGASMEAVKKTGPRAQRNPPLQAQKRKTKPLQA